MTLASLCRFLYRGTRIYYTKVLVSEQLLHSHVYNNGVVPKYAARQFCLLDSALYRKISPLEFLRDPEGADKLPNMPNRLGEWVNRFNRVSNWTASTLLEISDLSTRVRALKQFIRLARECMGMKNFNTSYAITSGLNHSTVQRLSKTWKVISHMRAFSC